MKQKDRKKPITSIFLCMLFFIGFQQKVYGIFSLKQQVETLAVINPALRAALAQKMAQAAAAAQVFDQLIKPDTNRKITYGSVVRFVHLSTKRALSTGDEVYNQGSKQNAVYCLGIDGQDQGQTWMIKGPYGHVDPDKNQVINLRDIVRFQNVKTGRNLHSHTIHSSKSGSQNEVSAYGDSKNDDNNSDWIIAEVKNGAGNSLCQGVWVKILHRNLSTFENLPYTGRSLHSHSIMLNKEYVNPGRDGLQEVTTYDKRDDNDWWVIQLITTPTEVEHERDRVEKQAKLVKEIIGTPDQTKTLQYGDCVRFVHIATGKAIASGDEVYAQGSAQNAVYGVDLDGEEPSDENANQWWIVREPLKEASKDIKEPLVIKDIVRFENMKTHHMLHSHGIPSPESGQQEVSAFSDPDHDDPNSNWLIAEIVGNKSLCEGVHVKLLHRASSTLDNLPFSGKSLHSHSIPLNKEHLKPQTGGLQEVTAYSSRDDNDWFGLQVAKRPLTAAEKELVVEEQAKVEEVKKEAVKEIEELKKAMGAQTAAEEAKVAQALEVASKLEEFSYLPAGFVEEPGNAKDVTIDFVPTDGGVELQAWAIGLDGSLLERKEGANPWYIHAVPKDDQGNALPNPRLRSISMADQAVYMVDESGRVWRYNHLGAKPTPAPVLGKKGESAEKQKKKEKTTKTKKSKKSKKTKASGPKKKGKKELERVKKWEEKQHQKEQKKKKKKGAKTSQQAAKE